MKFIRLLVLPVGFILIIWLAISLGNNPLFFTDIWHSIIDVQTELVLTTIFALILFWLGLELNHRTSEQNTHTHKPRFTITKINTTDSDEYGFNRSGSGLYIPKRAIPAYKPIQTEFWQGISTELVSAAVAGSLLGMIILIFQQYQSIQNRKSDLILQMSSPDNAFAIEAVRQLRDEGWLFDGTLHNANLSVANLQGANLKFANLRNVNLSRANLLDANLEQANLQDANLERANLQDVLFQFANLKGAILLQANLEVAFLRDANLEDVILVNSNLQNTMLERVNLQGANLTGAELQGANLTGANLQGANLTGANLQGADVRWANIENSSLRQADLRGSNLRESNLLNINPIDLILPYGSQWIYDIDMRKFTDLDHPEYRITLIRINQIRIKLGYSSIEFP